MFARQAYPIVKPTGGKYTIYQYDTFPERIIRLLTSALDRIQGVARALSRYCP